MFPVLFKIGSFPINTYGLLIAIGFLMAIQVAKRLAIRSHQDVDRVLDLAFWCLAVGFLGARFLFIVTQWSEYMARPLSMLYVWEGGLVFFGGPLAAMPFAAWYMKKHKMHPWKTLDIMMPGLVIAHAFGRIGCLAAGCCYGKPTNAEWGIKFYSDIVDRGLHGVYLHPTQIYESVALFVLFAGLLQVFRKKAFDGQVGLVYFMTYPIIRSIIEVFRGDSIRGFVIDGVFSTSQFISIVIFTIALLALIYRLKQVREMPVPVRARS